MLETVFLGALQGLTEFLPVSSSGHLVLAQGLLGWREPAVSFDVMLHLATMAATLVYFRREIVSLLAEWLQGFAGGDRRDTEGWRTGWAVLAGSVATVAVVLLVKPFVEKAFTSPLAVGVSLLATACVLWFGSNIRTGNRRLSVATGLWTGLAQAVAVFPGLSRSGLTIVTGLKRGLAPETAFAFSFFLSLPAIAGATLLQALDVPEGLSFFSRLPAEWAAGMAAAFITGLASLALLRRVVLRGRWRGFAVYCVAAGLVVIVVEIFRGGTGI